MPLDSLAEQLKARRRPAPTAKDFVDKARPARVSQTHSDYINKMIERVDRPDLRPEHVRDGFIALASGVVELESHMAEITAALGNKPESFDPVTQHVTDMVGALQKSMDSLVKTLQAIKLPEIKLPEQKETDLSSVHDTLGEIKTLIASTGRVVETKEPIPVPKEWTFEIKRGPSGYAKSIEAKAK